MFKGCNTCKDKEKTAEPMNLRNPTEAFEDGLLGTQGLRRGQDYEIYDTYFEFDNGTPGQIHTIEAGFENEQPLVLIHGFGSSAAFYYQIINGLKSHFHIYAIDMYGFGSSSRPKLENLEFESVATLFTTALEKWRLARKLENFVLMGHSLGGYISSQWVFRFNPPLCAYYLLSPAGFTSKTKDELLGQDPGFFKKQFMNLFDHLIHDKKINPFNLIFVGKEFFIRKKFTGKRLQMPEKEAGFAAKILSSTLDKDECGEKVVGVFLRFARYSHHPICDTLKIMKDRNLLNYPVSVIYGEKDWMDTAHSREMNRELGLNLEIYIVPDCDHQIILQNAQGLCGKLLADLYTGYEQLMLRQLQNQGVIPML